MDFQFLNFVQRIDQAKLDFVLTLLLFIKDRLLFLIVQARKLFLPKFNPFKLCFLITSVLFAVYSSDTVSLAKYFLVTLCKQTSAQYFL